MEKLDHSVRASFLVSTAIGVCPLFDYARYNNFGGFLFDWKKIKNNSKNFTVFQSDDDPYVSLGNGEKLAQELGIELTFIPNAGHFNKKAGYIKFDALLGKVEKVL